MAKGKRARRRRKKGGAIDAPLAAVSIAFLLAAMSIIAPYLTQGASYRELANGTDVETNEAIGWDALLAQNPETAAWLAVEGTGIDYPVVMPGEDKPDGWYLRHDFWGADSYIGCPYLDRRSEADGRHMLVYGHHLGLSGQMFSSIYDAYGQERFDSIGKAIWSTPDGGVTDFTPLMAMSVDKGYAPIQEFEFATVGELQSWLEDMKGDATAVSPDANALIDGASRVLTLVTCSSPIGGQRARTLLIFAS